MNLYLVLILFILVSSLCFHLLVELLNLRNSSAELPQEFQGYYDSEKYKRSQDYLRQNTLIDLSFSVFFTAVLISFLLWGGFNYIDQYARSFNVGSISTGLIFCGVLALASLALSLPVSIYRTFVIEEKFGFNRTTVKTFILDQIKAIFLSCLLGGLVLCLVFWFFETLGSTAWLWCWLFVTLFELGILFIAPAVIMPLFNKFIPLASGELKDAIEAFAKSQNFKLKGIFTMDGSRRSTKANAFFTGFGKFRRIVLFDTLISKHTVDELVAVLAHEIGHYKRRHIFRQLIVSILSSGFLFYSFSLLIGNEQLFNAFQMQDISIYASLTFIAILYSPVSTVISLFSHYLSRKYEFEADEYAVKTFKKPLALAEALKKLSVENLSNLTPHPLKVYVDYTHPPVIERVKRIRDLSQ